jgi:C4-type Zn-finger protein
MLWATLAVALPEWQTALEDAKNSQGVVLFCDGVLYIARAPLQKCKHRFGKKR